VTGNATAKAAFSAEKLKRGFQNANFSSLAPAIFMSRSSYTEHCLVMRSHNGRAPVVFA
jgi:hypothetical protein